MGRAFPVHSTSIDKENFGTAKLTTKVCRMQSGSAPPGSPQNSIGAGIFSVMRPCSMLSWIFIV